MATRASQVAPPYFQRCCEQLKRDEGFRAHPYRDATGALTIGYGFNLESDGLTEEEAASVLHWRVWYRYGDLIAALPWSRRLDEARQGVLLNMAYNVGVHGLLEFSVTLGHVRSGDYAAAADAMLQSKWAAQVGARSFRLAQQMRTGVWQ
jgi:lysozyme